MFSRSTFKQQRREVWTVRLYDPPPFPHKLNFSVQGVSSFLARIDMATANRELVKRTIPLRYRLLTLPTDRPVQFN